MAWSDYERGQWEAYNRLLNHLNTFENKRVLKKELYHSIMEMRPMTDPKKDPIAKVRKAIESKKESDAQEAFLDLLQAFADKGNQITELLGSIDSRLVNLETLAERADKREDRQ